MMRPSEMVAWSPLLDGGLRLQAIETLQAIAGSLGTVEFAAAEPEAGSLAGGPAGLAVLFAYLAQAGLASGGAEAAARLLDGAAESIATTCLAPSLYDGFTGVAWATEHLAGRVFEPDGEDAHEAIDETLREYLGQSPWPDSYDLVGGLTGIGVYALERLPSPHARDLLSLVVDRLDETAERGDRGITWLTPPGLLPDWQRALCPRGYYNLGLAHGVPGAIAVLAGACAADVRGATARRLVDGAVSWLLSNRMATESGAAFPSWIPRGAEPRAGRMAWCYGDLGIAAALLVTARVLDALSWEREAIAIARRAAICPMDRSGVRDAGLCHGAAGVAHIFNRFYQATLDETFADAARVWFARTLAMRQPGAGVAGYRAAAGEVDGTIRWIDDPGLLTGAAGIALALLAAVSGVEPAWDRHLLLSLPPALTFNARS
jgi:lantibiotic biosynthesis protein